VIDFLDIDGLRIRYKQAGHGAPILLLHGWGGQIESMDPIANALANQFAVTSIDFPGHGESALPARAWRVDDFLEATLRVMDRLGLDRPGIVAHSFGGRVSIKLAAAHPQRAGHILFAAGAGVVPPAGIGKRVRRLIGATAGRLRSVAHSAAPSTDSVLERLGEKLFPYLASRDYKNAGELRETLRFVVAEDLTPLLNKIRSKCLLIWGDQDRDTPLYCGETMKRLIAGSELIVFPGAGHFPYIDQMNKFNLLALKFFRE
jgi:pimeloyl-ACP methyl ester carboxylesterase